MAQSDISDSTSTAETTAANDTVTTLPVRFKQTKFDWTSSEGGPKGYPMQLISGNFSLEGGGSLYIPSGALLRNGWGDGRSTHVGGDKLKALPNRVSLSFFSYTENKFYSGDFKLPYQKILTLFKRGYIDPFTNKVETFSEIVAGMAPGGAVGVWLISTESRVEVFFGYAKEEPGNWKSINDNPKYPREEYVRLNIEESLNPEQMADLKQNGIPYGLWERYHKARYPWQPVFDGMVIKDNRVNVVHYRNGEWERIDLNPAVLAQHPDRAVPDEVFFVEQSVNSRPVSIEVYFKSDTLLDAFEKLGTANLPLQLRFFLRKTDKGQHMLNVELKNANEAIKIPFELKVYGVPKPIK